jgi:hypothetical protein
MKRKASQQRKRSTRPYSERQIAGLRASTAERKQETVRRLQTAIQALKDKKQAITAQSIYTECGLHYSSYARNDEAIMLFRANSTHLTQHKKRAKRKGSANDQPPPSRNSLMNYKKPQLVSRLDEAKRENELLKQQLATLADTYLQREARVVELEARLAELEPYRSFVEQVRLRVREEEYQGEGPFSS